MTIENQAMNATAQLRTERELLEQIVADFDADIPCTYTLNDTFIAEARALLAGERKPVAEVAAPNDSMPYKHLVRLMDIGELAVGTKLYIAPPQQEWIAVLDIAAEALDKDTYDEYRRHYAPQGNPPDDAEITITLGTRRKLNALFAELEKLRPLPSAGERS